MKLILASSKSYLNLMRFRKLIFRVIFFSLPVPKQKWIPALSNSCIKNRKTGRVYNVYDLKACQMLCERSSIVKCLSVSFEKSSKICYFNGADTSIADLESPCFYQFSEPYRHCKCGITLYSRLYIFSFVLFLQSWYLMLAKCH